jgi:hypothetical protein
MESDADAMIRTADEKAVDYVLDLVLMVSRALMILSPATSLGYFAGLLGGGLGHAGKYANADTVPDREQAVWETVVMFASELLPFVSRATALVNRVRRLVKTQAVDPLFGGLPYVTSASRFTQAAYRSSRNLVAQGSAAKVYRLDSAFLVKEYQTPLHFGTRVSDAGPSAAGTAGGTAAVRWPVYNNVLIEANRNAAAFNRLYGPGSALLTTHAAGEPLSRIVAVKLKQIPGQSLSALLHSRDASLLQGILRRMTDEGIDSVSVRLSQELGKKGINHLDINAGNILYDSSGRRFRLVDFDQSVIRPPKVVTTPAGAVLNYEMLPEAQIEAMQVKIRSDLKEFRWAIQQLLRGTG